MKVGEVFTPRRLETPLDRLVRRTAGKRSYTLTSRKRGRYVSSRLANGRVTDLALDATLREAAPHQIHRRRSSTAFAIRKEDLRQKVRVRRVSNAVLFVVDASWSMAAAKRMEATKGAILSLLIDAYQRRDSVGLIVFQKERARLVLPLTTSVELAQKALKDIPVGGKTPLSSALLLAYRVLMREKRRHPETMPMLILLTDGAGNVSLTEIPAQEEALMLARYIRHSPIYSVVINMEHTAFDRGLAQKLAEALDAPCYCLQELKAADLYSTVRREIEQHHTSVQGNLYAGPALPTS
ncbi:MAG: vWA domain-containing protein [Anaerolineae bacterium]